MTRQGVQLSLSARQDPISAYNRGRDKRDPHALSSEAYAIFEAILTSGFMASETGIEPSPGILAPTANRRPYCRGPSLATLQCPDHQGG